MKFKFLVKICLIGVASFAYTDTYEVDTIQNGDTLEVIARRNMYRVKIKYSDRYADYEADIKEWNPKIKDWQNPPRGNRIYVDFPYNPYVACAVSAPELNPDPIVVPMPEIVQPAPPKVVENVVELKPEPELPPEPPPVVAETKPLEAAPPEVAKVEKEIPRVDVHDYYFDPRFSLYGFYAATMGNYTEDTSSQVVTSSQNFPVTLGLGYSLTNENRVHFVTGSGYYAMSAKSEAGATADNAATEIDIPGEMGFNTYYQYFIKDFKLGVYTGYDYEKLNTFNTNEIVNGTKIKNIENNLHYGTVGANKSFTLFNLNMNFKASISQTLASSTSGTGKALSGYKYILYYTYKPDGRFSFSAFFKHHELSGPTELSINRIGLSVGISIF